MTKRYVQRWGDVERHAVNCVTRSIREGVPEQWVPRIDALGRAVEDDGRVPCWRKSAELLEQLQAFKAEHGEARRWLMSDAEVCEMARDIVAKMVSWLGGAAIGKVQVCGPVASPEAFDWVSLSEPEQIDVLRIVCETLGVDMPVGLMAAGVIARGQCERWWRRALRKRVARIVEHGAIRLGVVNRNEGAYASNNAVRARKQQLARNAAAMGRAVLRNEAGQCYRLSDLAALSVANPDNRRGELMVRIRGAEEQADAAGHPGFFGTLTCPSRFHAVLSTGKKGGGLKVNPKYDRETSPREAQAWLREKWGRLRSAMARDGITVYGIRVAEPHHDGCPHWHVLLWFGSDLQMLQARYLIRKYWLSDDGDERGAVKNRVNIKRMDRGGAAGYVAKYVAKNVGGTVNVDGHTDDGHKVQTGGVKGVERVDAWAGLWGVRQFQTVGLPPVGVWRKLRGVDSDQVETARVQGDGVAWRAWAAVHKVGSVAADFAGFIRAMGGVCRKRAEWALRVAYRVEPGVFNEYGETVERKTAVGVEVARSGRWLVSKKMAWVRVASETVKLVKRVKWVKPVAVSEAAGGTPAEWVRVEIEGVEPVEVSETAGGTHAAWTRFNNCTQRILGKMRASLLGLEKFRFAPPSAVVGVGWGVT